jgi:hypothetical protein
MEADATTSVQNGITFVDHPDRPGVRWFFEQWGEKTAVLSGFEVQSLTHERCKQLVLTGRSDSGVDDWPSILGAHSQHSLVLPHVILDGYAFTNQYSSQVVRVGDKGQLADLLDGSAVLNGDAIVSLPSSSAEALEEAALLTRLTSLSGGSSGQEGQFLAAYKAASEQHRALLDYSLDFEIPIEGCERDIAADAGKAFDLFALGTTRCAMIRYNGWCGEGWDTHQNLELQSTNFQDLFSYLDLIMLDLSERPDLSDRVTIVVFSEMGRAIQLNNWGGKDHWTYTSAMLIGSGVQGGQVVGALDDGGKGQAIQLDTGELREAGTRLVPAHIGATLLALGDVDPGPFTDGAQPIEALIR